MGPWLIARCIFEGEGGKWGNGGNVRCGKGPKSAQTYCPVLAVTKVVMHATVVPMIHQRRD